MLSLYGAAETYFIPITVDTKAMNVDPTVIENIKNMTGFMFGYVLKIKETIKTQPEVSYMNAIEEAIN